MTNIITPSDLIQPRIVSLKELRAKLKPRIMGWGWADDAINDLWLLGAPVPQACVCPEIPPCPMRQCPHIKRILMPRKFAQWWGEVCQRTGANLTPKQALELAKIR